MTGRTLPTDDLDAIGADLWARLRDAARGRHPAWHTPVVATSDGDLRVMVLRDVDAVGGTCRFHTDARSPKVGLVASVNSVPTPPLQGQLFWACAVPARASSAASSVSFIIVGTLGRIDRSCH